MITAGVKFQHKPLLKNNYHHGRVILKNMCILDAKITISYAQISIIFHVRDNGTLPFQINLKLKIDKLFQVKACMPSALCHYRNELIEIHSILNYHFKCFIFMRNICGSYNTNNAT